MKKLLLVGALLALGATAFAVNPAKDTQTTANVEVRAEITDDFFIISDIYGKPIVVDFGRLFADQKQSAVTFVDYKVTAKEAAETNDIAFDITLGEKKNEPTEVVIETDKDPKNDKGRMKSFVSLSEYAGEIKVGENEYRGRINGTISVDELKGKQVGVYTGNTELKIVVNK